MKLIESNTRRKPLTLVLAKVFLVMTLKTQVTKAKTTKRDDVKLKTSCTKKGRIIKMKKESRRKHLQTKYEKQEKIFASHLSDKVLISKIQKEFIQLNSKKKKKKHSSFKMGKGLEQTFFQRRYTNGQQVHEKMLNITNHQRNGNQTTTRYHLTPVSTAIIHFDIWQN